MRKEAQILVECQEILKKISKDHEIEIILEQTGGLSKKYNLWCDKQLVYNGTLKECDLITVGLFIMSNKLEGRSK